MARNNNFYLSQRFDQVNLIKGTWSGEKDKISHGKKIRAVIMESAVNSIKSLYIDNIGGGEDIILGISHFLTDLLSGYLLPVFLHVFF